MKSKILLSVLTFFILSFSNAQKITGLWEVTKVTVGSKNLTPVAKWFHIKKNKTFTSGNGWTQNSIGSWGFDKKTKKYSAKNSIGITDEFGAFTVNFSKKAMTWERKENEDLVKVTLKKIENIPQAPQDKIQGLWLLSNNTNKDYLFIRPDRLYKLKNKEKIANGYWHVDGHRPILTLLNYNKTLKDLVFEISFQNKNLRLKEVNGKKRTFIYKRIQKLPE